jgi:hypothetical protein
MKQPQDKFTQELPELIEHWAPAPASRRYRFHIETMDGHEVEWRGLSKTKAIQMYRCTHQTQPSNVKSFGWEEMK